MLESLLRRPNFYWGEESFQPSLKSDSLDDLALVAATLQGQFSLAVPGPDGEIILLRDRLGINKLFFAIHESGMVLAATFLIDLVDRGVPFEAIYSVPAGHLLAVDPAGPTLTQRRYFDVDAEAEKPSLPLGSAARHIRDALEAWFSRLAAQFGQRQIGLCLSGGLDSSVIAALATKYFADVTAYTYGYAEAGRAASEDVYYARQVADFLGIPFRLVPASADDVFDVLDDALCYGQDWRDFNVHCAIVNEILARRIASDAETCASGPPLVLTGDLMNEFLADYAPLSHENREFYRLPQVGPDRLRTALIRGLDAGDRELGIFNHHGIDLIQPYGLLVDQYLRLPASLIGGERSKPDIVREVAGDLLPSFLFARRKVRAQVGDSLGPGGILSALLRTGRDAAWLRRAFCHRFGITQEPLLDSFIRLGRYRSASGGPDGRATRNGYYAGANRSGR